jgi:4-amino-4-deoxy-L-arabinose transferase-like glycosyltransferase
MENLFSKYKFLMAIISLFVLRGFLNAYIPLMDKTEARYAEIARIMAETGNWITPQIDYGIPFWAKPPLSTWLSAISIKIFGANEFALRFPYLLLSFVILIIVSKFVQKKENAVLLGFILITIPEFLLHAGVVSTDTTLAFCVAMVFLGFWKAINSEKSSYWSYIIFVFFGFGLLAKGPIIFILTVPPIFIWTIYYREVFTFFKKIPIFSGTILTVLIAAPWYYLAEMETKGFLEYFIVGEHFKRFFDSSWEGDKYGFAKTQPFGIIWVFLFAFAIPWFQVLLIQLWKNFKQILQNRWIAFLLLWLVWTPLFFTSSSSLIHPYILPSIIPIALIVEYYWQETKKKNTIFAISLIFPILIVVATIASLFGDNLERYTKTDKYLLQKTNYQSDKLYFFGEKSYSSQFYSNGKINNISATELEKKLNQKDDFHIIIENRDSAVFDNTFARKLKLLHFNNYNGIYKTNY